MKKINAIIIDDERHARESLTSLLKLYCPQVAVIDEAANIQDAYQKIEQLSPDLVFLDIEIGNDSGFDLLENLNTFSFQLIFTTAHSEFAIKAFKVNALDYLLKPIDPNQLQAAIKKVEEATDKNNLHEQLQLLTRSLNPLQNGQISITSLDGITLIDTKEILRIEGSANYSTFYMKNGEKITASKSLKHYEELLPQKDFFRCHQSHLINICCIKKIWTKDGNIIELKDGTQIPLVKKRKEGLLSRLSV